MVGITDLSTYLAGLALIILLPGPNSLYVVSVAARLGPRVAYRAAAGVLCGDTVLMTLSAGGVASLLQTSPVLFAIVKFAGAGYLSWLAFGMLRGAWKLWRGRDTRHAARAEATETAAGTAPEGWRGGAPPPPAGGARRGAPPPEAAGAPRPPRP
ncbi:LysE family transporter, partial [Streptomyces celluloflavus]